MAEASKCGLPRVSTMDTDPCAVSMQARRRHQPQDAHGEMAGSSGGPGMSLGRGQLGLAGYESRLRCLKECRSELIRCSGRLTARKTPTARVSGEKKGGGSTCSPLSAPPIKYQCWAVGSSSVLEAMRDKSHPREAVKSQGATTAAGG